MLFGRSLVAVRRQATDTRSVELGANTQTRGREVRRQATDTRSVELGANTQLAAERSGDKPPTQGRWSCEQTRNARQRGQATSHRHKVGGAGSKHATRGREVRRQATDTRSVELRANTQRAAERSGDKPPTAVELEQTRNGEVRRQATDTRSVELRANTHARQRGQATSHRHKVGGAGSKHATRGREVRRQATDTRSVELRANTQPRQRGHGRQPGMATLPYCTTVTGAICSNPACSVLAGPTTTMTSLSGWILAWASLRQSSCVVWATAESMLRK